MRFHYFHNQAACGSRFYLMTLAITCLVFSIMEDMTLGAENQVNNNGHAIRRYGPTLAQVKTLGVGPSMDVTVAGDILYVIGHGKLTIFDITSPLSPKKLGQLTGLGQVRQIEVTEHVAYVTSRADGLFLVDVREPTKPKLLSHFDTIEMATGIWITGKVALVAMRHYGVQLIDVRDPGKPLHLGLVRTGEAQSVMALNGIAYVGVWGERKLVICDISNPRKPTVLAKADLDGFGDGVWVRGKYCYVSTGHHRPGLRKKDNADPAFGQGHGMEIFDVSDPKKPIFISRVKTPRLYRISGDMWDVAVAGKYAYMADTYNGFFVVDISNPRQPRFVAHHQLPYYKKKQDHFLVSGFAATKGCFYLAGAWSDVHVIAAPRLAMPIKVDPDTPPVITSGRQIGNSDFRVYRPDGQVYAVAMLGDTALVAAGQSGLHEVRLWPDIRKIAGYKTGGLALDVKVNKGVVFVAEGKGGLSIWKRAANGLLQRISRYCPRGRSIRQVVVAAQCGRVLVQADSWNLEILNISDLEKPKLLLRDRHPGLLYGYQITEGLFEDRYACCFWHVSGFFWYDLIGESKPVFSGNNYAERVGASNGLALLPNKTEALCTLSNGRYFILKRTENQPLKKLVKYGVSGKRLRGGKPSIYGNRLYVANRAYGTVNILDIADLEKPRLLGQYKLPGNPGIVIEHNGTAIIPAGYQGLLVVKKSWDEP